MSDFRARLLAEEGQLLERIDKLKEFLASDKYDTLPEIDRKDLKEQLTHMEGYASILCRRADRKCNNA